MKSCWISFIFFISLHGWQYFIQKSDLFEHHFFFHIETLQHFSAFKGPSSVSTDTFCEQGQQSTCYNFIFRWPCISFQFFANDQLDTLFYIFIYYTSVHVSSTTVFIIRRSNCINTSSGMISVCKWLLGMPVRRELSSRWCINTIRSPGDEHCDAQNM
jgi:hypothetical protein